MSKVWLKDRIEPTKEDLEWIAQNYEEEDMDDWYEDEKLEEDWLDEETD